MCLRFHSLSFVCIEAGVQCFRRERLLRRSLCLWLSRLLRLFLRRRLFLGLLNVHSLRTASAATTGSATTSTTASVSTTRTSRATTRVTHGRANATANATSNWHALRCFRATTAG